MILEVLKKYWSLIIAVVFAVAVYYGSIVRADVQGSILDTLVEGYIRSEVTDARHDERIKNLENKEKQK